MNDYDYLKLISIGYGLQTLRNIKLDWWLLFLYPIDQLLQRTVDHDYLIGEVEKETYIEYDGKILRAIMLELFADRLSVASQSFSRLTPTNNEEGEVFVLGEVKQVLDDPECAATKLFGKTCSDTFLQLEENIEKIHHPYGPSLFHDLVGRKVVLEVQTRRINNQIYGGSFKVVNIIRDVPFFHLVEPNQSNMGVIRGSTFRLIFQDSIHFGRDGGYRNQLISDPSIQAENIKEIITHTLSLKMCSSFSRLDKLCILVGKVTTIIQTQNWWSLSCVCASPVSRVGNVFYCGLCKVEYVGALPSFRLKVIVSHSNRRNIPILDDPEVEQVLNQSCSQFLGEQASDSEELLDYVVPARIVSKFLDHKFLFVVDSRPIGYDLNKSLHIVRDLSDDSMLINFFEVANNLYEVGSDSTHIPLESSHGMRFQSPIQNNSVSSSADHLSSASPTCVLDWPNGSFEGTYRIFGGGVRSFDSSGRLQNDYDLSLVDCIRIGVEHFVEGAGEVDTMDESSL
ncbi:hypothetical protein PIB30_054985 [Stylosanthes scabra]|uniref:Uncharacterized protein n=1 Tax=Stylosanthes scabra TaxID=79078 RepID=A0ABU6VLB8_9FABA|nr:hypothetical protein [Stylosanthes scabra]